MPPLSVRHPKGHHRSGRWERPGVDSGGALGVHSGCVRRGCIGGDVQWGCGVRKGVLWSSLRKGAKEGRRRGAEEVKEG